MQNTRYSVFESVLPQHILVFCHTPSNCYHICKSPTIMQKVVSTKDDLRPHRMPPLTLLAPCWCRLHRCHGCHVVATIATITIAPATATLPPAPFLLLLLPLFGFCPHAVSAFTTVACPRQYCCWLSMPLSLSPRPQTTVPCSFPRRGCLCFYHCLYHCSPW